MLWAESRGLVHPLPSQQAPQGAFPGVAPHLAVSWSILASSATGRRPGPGWGTWDDRRQRKCLILVGRLGLVYTVCRKTRVWRVMVGPGWQFAPPMKVSHFPLEACMQFVSLNQNLTTWSPRVGLDGIWKVVN